MANLKAILAPKRCLKKDLLVSTLLLPLSFRVGEKIGEKTLELYTAELEAADAEERAPLVSEEAVAIGSLMVCTIAGALIGQAGRIAINLVWK